MEMLHSHYVHQHPLGHTAQPSVLMFKTLQHGGHREHSVNRCLLESLIVTKLWLLQETLFIFSVYPVTSVLKSFNPKRSHP